MRHKISIKNKDGLGETHLIPEEIYLYIRQLEVYINNPEVTSFLERYPERFNKALRRLKEKK